MYIPKDNVESPLYVVCVIFNPVRFKQRYKLYRDFQVMVRNAGAILITIEAAFGERTFALEEHAYPGPQEHDGGYKSHGPAPTPPAAHMPQSRLSQDYIKVRVDQQQEIWLKENLQNLAVHHLPDDARYVAFIDADVQFTRPDWVSETLHALQHYDVVQMFSTAVDLSPTYEPIMAHKGFGFCHVHGAQARDNGAGGYGYGEAGKVVLWHPGFCWAWRRDSLDAVGGLFDVGVTGANDWHMAKALIGKGVESYAGGVSQDYKNHVLRWQDNAVEQLKMNVGYIDGTINHFWHGRKISRGYETRWKIVVNNQYEPSNDILRDWRGIYKLTTKKFKLRDDLRAYFRSRSEDDIYCPQEDDKLIGVKGVLK